MLNLISKFNNSAEARESKDEVLIGEVVFAMAHLGCPTIGFHAGSDLQYVKFKPVGNNVLHTITVLLDRKTGDSVLQQAVVGSKATLTIVGEVKNHFSDPDDLVNMFRTDLANVFRNPWLGKVKLDHQLNSVTATKKQIIDIDELTTPPEGRGRMNELLRGVLSELHENLAAYKK